MAKPKKILCTRTVFSSLEKGNTDPYGALLCCRLAKAVDHARLLKPSLLPPAVVMLCRIPGSLNSGHKNQLAVSKFVILRGKKLSLDAINIKGKGEKGEVSLNYKIDLQYDK